MLPVSGAEQLNASADHRIRPISSAHSAYSRLVSCSPSKSKLSSTCCERAARRHEQVPQARRLGLGLQVLDQGQRLPAVAARDLAMILPDSRPDVRVDEGLDLVAEESLPFRKVKIHAALPCLRFASVRLQNG